MYVYVAPALHESITNLIQPPPKPRKTHAYNYQPKHTKQDAQNALK